MGIIAPEKDNISLQYIRVWSCGALALSLSLRSQLPRTPWRFARAVEDRGIYHVCLLVRRTSCCLQNMIGYPQKAWL